MDTESSIVIAPTERGAGPCGACAERSSRARGGLTVARWREAVAGAPAGASVRLAGVEPLLEPEIVRALEGAPLPAGQPFTVETHGRALIDERGTTWLARLGVTRLSWCLHGHEPELLDAGGRARWIAGVSRARAAGLELEIVIRPVREAFLNPSGLMLLTDLVAAAGATPVLTWHPSLARPRRLVRALTLLVRAFVMRRVPVRVDRDIPPCLRDLLPMEAVTLPPIAPVVLARDRVCGPCAHHLSERCAGFPAAWTVDAGDREEARARVAQRSFRAEDAEAVALTLGLRRALRMVTPRAAVDHTTLGARAAGFVTRVDEDVELDADGNVFPPRPGGPIDPGRSALTPGAVLVAARSDEDAERVASLDAAIRARVRPTRLLELHRELGALLGYPACCVDAFVDDLAARSDERQSQPDHLGLLRAAAGRSARLDWRLNPGLVDRDASLVSHVPCRFDCPASLALAERVLTELRSRAPERAARMEARLRSVVVLAEDGSALVTRGALDDDAGAGAGAIQIDEAYRATGVFKDVWPGQRIERAPEWLVLDFG
jgi:hypothetical protein